VVGAVRISLRCLPMLLSHEEEAANQRRLSSPKGIGVTLRGSSFA